MGFAKKQLRGPKQSIAALVRSSTSRSTPVSVPPLPLRVLFCWALNTSISPSIYIRAFMYGLRPSSIALNSRVPDLWAELFFLSPLNYYCTWPFFSRADFLDHFFLGRGDSACLSFSLSSKIKKVLPSSAVFAGETTQQTSFSVATKNIYQSNLLLYACNGFRWLQFCTLSKPLWWI